MILENIKKSILEKIDSKYQIFQIERPKNVNSDLAIPLFKQAQLLKQNIKDIFEDIKLSLNDISFIQNIEFLNGFLNIYLNKELISKSILEKIINEKELYPIIEKTNQNIFLEYSSPNIAKNFSVGHLRSTIIGDSLTKIYKKAGYNVFSENYLGDWGTQFGKMICAYKMWGDEKELEKDTLTYLQKLYVDFHNQSQIDPSLEDKAREISKELENNNEEYLKLWSMFKELSIANFKRIYKILDVDFDNYSGESFYKDMSKILFLLEKKNLLKLDQGATIVELGQDIPPALIKRKDGATLYLTRDLTAILDRYNKHKFEKIIYCVGNEQKLHFEQLNRVCNLLGYNFNINHVNFGLILQDGKKMSTRRGKTSGLEAILNEAISKAKEQILEKNPNIENIDEVARKIGVGAVKYNDLKNERNLDIEFNLEQMLKFEGQTGPYNQYTIVRINSILKDIELDYKNIDFKVFENEQYFEIIKLMDQFEEVIKKAQELNSPAQIARYIYTLSQTFNKLYSQTRFLNTDNLKLQNTNLVFIEKIKQVIEEGLRLLGIHSILKM